MITTSLDVEVAVEIGRPIEEVWEFVSDGERLPEWIDEFVAVVKETEGPIGMGTVFRYTVSPGERSSTFEIVEWEPGRRLAWDGPPLPWRGGGGRPRGSLEVSEVGAGRTRLVARFRPELSGTLVLMSPFLKRWLRRQRSADTGHLKQLLEAARDR